MSFYHRVLFCICKGSLWGVFSFAPLHCSRHEMMILHNSFIRGKRADMESQQCFVSLSTFQVGWWGCQGRDRIALKIHYIGALLLLYQWSFVTLLCYIGFKFINRNQHGEMPSRNRRKSRKQNSLSHLPSLIKRSKVLSVLVFFWLSAWDTWGLLFPM